MSDKKIPHVRREDDRVVLRINGVDVATLSSRAAFALAKRLTHHGQIADWFSIGRLVQQCVAEYFGCTLDTIVHNRGRNAEVSLWRHISMFLCYKLTPLSLAKINSLHNYAHGSYYGVQLVSILIGEHEAPQHAIDTYRLKEGTGFDKEIHKDVCVLSDMVTERLKELERCVKT